MVFNKDWLYINLQSEHGCSLSVHVSFKSDFVPLNKPMQSTKGSMMEGAGQSTMERSHMTSPRAGGSTQKANESMMEETDFS